MAEGGFSTLTCHLQRSCCHRSVCTAICPRSVPSLRLCHCSGTEDRQNAPTVSCERTLPPPFCCGGRCYPALAVPAIHRPATATGAYINGYQIVADEGVTMAFGKRF